MKVRELIDRLLDQPMNNTVYVGDISHGVNERGWDGELQEVVGDPGVFATFLGFNETGLNNYMNTEVRDDPDQVPGRTITDSDYQKIIDETSVPYGVGFTDGFHQAGGSITPDPEPTSAEKLPGRTITEGDLIAAVDETNHEDMNEYQKARALLVHLGHTVPDPEPTNAEKLDKDIQEVDLHLTSRQLAEALIERGWTKAPEEQSNE